MNDMYTLRKMLQRAQIPSKAVTTDNKVTETVNGAVFVFVDQQLTSIGTKND